MASPLLRACQSQKADNYPCRQDSLPTSSSNKQRVASTVEKMFSLAIVLSATGVRPPLPLLPLLCEKFLSVDETIFDENFI